MQIRFKNNFTRARPSNPSLPLHDGHKSIRIVLFWFCLFVDFVCVHVNVSVKI